MAANQKNNNRVGDDRVCCVIMQLDRVTNIYFSLSPLNLSADVLLQHV